MNNINDHSEKKNVILFVNSFNQISILELAQILEWLDDNEYLTSKGKTFRMSFWSLFIKKDN